MEHLCSLMSLSLKESTEKSLAGVAEVNLDVDSSVNVTLGDVCSVISHTG